MEKRSTHYGDVSNWIENTDSVATIASAENVFINFDGVHAKWIRMIWEPTAGTGSADITFFAKGQ